MKRRRSTESAHRGVVGALPLSVYVDGLPATALAAWDLPAGAGGMKKAPSHMGDPVRVQRLLSRTTAVGLCVLELLVETGGICEFDDCLEAVSERIEVPTSLVDRAFAELAHCALAVPVTTSYERAVGLLEPSASVIADMVFGVTLPEPPVGEWLPGSMRNDPELASMLAVATMAQHHFVRATKKGWIHRGDVKKHARRLDMKPDELEDRLESALLRRVLVARAGRFELDGDALLEVSRGGGWLDPSLRQVLEAGPISQELFLRQETRAGYQPHFCFSGDLPAAREAAFEQLRELDGVARSVVDGEGWLSLADADALPAANVDGFVTPSLEVLVGPDPDARVVAQIGLGAELVKLDRVITFRLRPQTVRSMVARGRSVGALLETLEIVGKHGVPESVRALVLDWAERAKVAECAPVASFRVPAMHHEAACRVVGERLLGSFEPGHVGVAYRDGEAVRSDLEAAGFELQGRLPRLVGEPGPTREKDDVDLDLGESLPFVDLLGKPQPDPELRRRVREELACGFAESASSLSGYEPDFEGLSAAQARDLIREMVDPELPASVRKAIDLLLKKHAALDAAFETWASGFEPEERDVAHGIVRQPFNCFPLVCLAPGPRRQLLASSLSPTAAIDRSMALVQQRKMSPEGRRIMKAFVKPAFVRWMGEALGQPQEEPSVAPDQSDLEKLRQIEKLLSSGEPGIVFWQGTRGAKSETVLLDAFTGRGKEQVLLFTELDSERSRAVPLKDVLAVVRVGR